MRYLLLCYFNEQRWNEIPEEERTRILNDYHKLIQETISSGHHVGGAMLAQTTDAKTVRAKSGKLAITDGPFAETKEHLGGYHIMECTDFEEALNIASRIPTIPAGGVIEVRPIAFTEQ